MKNKLIHMQQLRHQLICIMALAYLLHAPNGALAANERNAVIKQSSQVLAIAVDLNRDGKIDRSETQPRIIDEKAINNTNLDYAGSVSDKTHPNLPYRFWVNNDLDVVNYRGKIKWDKVDCTEYNNYASKYKQECEQWDETASVTNNNTSASRLQRIESYRDLEDFAPILMYIAKGYSPKDYVIKLRAVGVSINLFGSDWRDDGDNVAHAYIFDTAKTTIQVDRANKSDGTGHFPTVMLSGTEAIIDQNIIDRYFDPNTGKAKFIFEAIAPSAASCSENAKNCYLELEVSKKNDDTFTKLSSRLYLDVRGIKKYYQHVTAGTAQNSGDTYQTTDDYSGETLTFQNSFHASYVGGYANAPESDKELDIYQGVYPQDEITKDLVVLVHGWRMLDSEKASFAETSFKRLYWSGYKSQFATFSWPTGWFEKPAHIYSTFGLLGYVLGNERNYDTSEKVARMVGTDFRNWLINTPRPSTHVIAHSMGNIVVSEALKYVGTGSLIASYTASQAAVGAGSYDSNAVDMSHELQVPLCSANDVVEAWRCYNTDNELQVDDTPFDMPPDMYRDNLVVDDGLGNLSIRHGQTTKENMGPKSNGNYYFKEISARTDRILNFYNADDIALTAWEFNQLTKPDYSQGPSWFYTNSYRKTYSQYETCVVLSSADNPEEDCASMLPAIPGEVVSEFQAGGVVVPYSVENAFRILAHSVPERTEPLGQTSVLGEVTTGENHHMTGFTTSNQDHSAEFHGYYSEITVKPGAVTAKQRAAYWNTMLFRSLRLDPLTNYTGLKNNISNGGQ